MRNMPRNPQSSRRIALGAAWVVGIGAAVPAEALTGTDAERRGAGTDAGAPLASFVPAGFRVAEVVRGALDADDLRDAALVLESRRADRRGARARRLVVLLARPEGRFVRAGDGRRVLLCTTCGTSGRARTPVEVAIRGRELVVRQAYGRRVVTTQTFRFRLREGRVLLARYEERNRVPATGQWASTRANLLTGDHVIETAVAGRDQTYDAFNDRPRMITLEACLQGAPLNEPD
jgi:hypothetical protein